MPLLTTPPLSSRMKETAMERIRRYQRDELALDRSIREFYRALVPDFMEELDRYFLDSFVVKIGRDGQPKQVWDFFKAAENYAVPKLIESYDAMSRAGEQEVGDLLDESLTDGFNEGYLLGLWMLNEAGVEDVYGALPPPEAAHARNLLMVLGIGGVTYANRLNKWTSLYEEKATRWLRASIFSESTRDETITALGYISGALESRVVALGGDELYRAYNLGQKQAWSQFEGFVAGELWLTREDELVCPICRPLHMRIVWQEPIIDTHPNCRCQKVPILTDANGMLINPQGRPIEYPEFRQTFLKR